MPKATAVVITSDTKSITKFKKPGKPLPDYVRWRRGRERNTIQTDAKKERTGNFFSQSITLERKLLTIDGDEIKLLFDKTEEEKRLDGHFNAACPFFKLEKELNKSGRKKKYKWLAISII